MSTTVKTYRVQSFDLQSMNDVLNDIGLRISALENAAFLTLPPLTLQTGPTITAGQAPFPAKVTVPGGLAPTGLVLLRLENLDINGPAGLPVFGVTLMPRIASGAVWLDYVSGLDINTQYRLTLGAKRG